MDADTKQSVVPCGSAAGPGTGEVLLCRRHEPNVEDVRTSTSQAQLR